MALDDIQFKNCAPDQNECQTYKDFQCGDSFCIPEEQRCDAQFDCNDKTDENDCPEVAVSYIKWYS